MECYKLVDGRLMPVADPTSEFEEQALDVDDAIRRAGYTVRVCNSELESDCAAIAIYETEQRNKPRYYIDVMGNWQGIAALVADDFLSLLATLKEIEPLTSIIALAQQALIHAERVSCHELERDAR